MHRVQNVGEIYNSGSTNCIMVIITSWFLFCLPFSSPNTLGFCLFDMAEYKSHICIQYLSKNSDTYFCSCDNLLGAELV